MESVNDRRAFREGVAYSVSAYVIWGLFPLYVRLLHGVAPVEFVVHRCLWSLVFLGAVLTLRRQWAWLPRALRDPVVRKNAVVTALFLSINWFAFVWAVAQGRIVDASLGYFINPLVSIALGAVFLHERLSTRRKGAVVLAAAGVLWLVFLTGQVPWIGLTVAISFGIYGLLRKRASLGVIEGLTFETLVLAPVALAILWWLAAHHQSRFFAPLSSSSVTSGASVKLKAALVLCGPITAIPLLLFGAGARRLPLSFLGILQYVGPTLQLGVGIFVGHEAFSAPKFVGYAFIWVAFLVASSEVFQSRGLAERS